MCPAIRNMLSEIWHALGGEPGWPERIDTRGHGDLPSAFAMTELAAATVGAALVAVAELIEMRDGVRRVPLVDRRLASMWFDRSIHPIGWTLPPAWDAIAGDYRGPDGWIRLHTNAYRHRAAALDVLGTPAIRTEVAREVD